MFALQSRMSGASVGCSQPCPGRAPLRRCKNRGEKKNVIFIDADIDSFDNVIIIDVPESSKRTHQPSNVLRKDRKHQSTRPRAGVIFLDDDDNTDHHFGNGGVNNNVQNDVNLDTGTSSSMQSRRKSGGLGNSSETVGDECQFIRENAPPVKLSKCKRTYSGKSSARNRYGLGTDSDSCPSESDFPDCELMEDSFGRVREQWEKASSRRKTDTRNGRSGIGDADVIFKNSPRNVDAVNDCGQHEETSFNGKNGEEKEPPPHSVPRENVNSSCDHHYGKQTCKEDDGCGLESILKTPLPRDEDDPHSGNAFAEGPSCNAKFFNSSHFGGVSSSFREEQCPKEPSSFTCQEKTGQVNHVEKDFQDRPRTVPGEPCLSKEDSYAAKANLSEPFISHLKDFVRSQRGRTGSSSEDTEKIHQKTSSIFSAEKEIASERTSTFESGLSAKNVSHTSSPNIVEDGLVHGRTSLQKNSSRGMESGDGNVCFLDNFQHSHKNPFVFSNMDGLQTGETVKSTDNSQQKNEKHDLLEGKVGEAGANVEDCMISEREKLKETDEYKRAIEEEWASRQRALQIQVFMHLFSISFLSYVVMIRLKQLALAVVMLEVAESSSYIDRQVRTSNSS